MAFDSNVETGSAEFQVDVRAFRCYMDLTMPFGVFGPINVVMSIYLLIVLHFVVTLRGECQAVSESLILEKISPKNEVVKSKSRRRLDDEKLPQDATSHISSDIVNVAASFFLSPDINNYCRFKVSFKISLKKCDFHCFHLAGAKCEGF
jgi:hypothetical protein